MKNGSNLTTLNYADEVGAIFLLILLYVQIDNCTSRIAQPEIILKVLNLNNVKDFVSCYFRNFGICA